MCDLMEHNCHALPPLLLFLLVHSIIFGLLLFLPFLLTAVLGLRFKLRPNVVPKLVV